MTDRPHIRTEVAPGRFHYRPAPDPAWREQEVVPDQARRGPLSEEDAGMKPEQRVRYTGPDVRGELLGTVLRVKEDGRVLVQFDGVAHPARCTRDQIEPVPEYEGEDHPMSAIDAVAVALCGEDEQRHLRLERRDGTPCRSHVNDAWTAVEAVLVLLQGLLLRAVRPRRHDQGPPGVRLGQGALIRRFRHRQ